MLKRRPPCWVSYAQILEERTASSGWSIYTVYNILVNISQSIFGRIPQSVMWWDSEIHPDLMQHLQLLGDDFLSSWSQQTWCRFHWGQAGLKTSCPWMQQRVLCCESHQAKRQCLQHNVTFFPPIHTLCITSQTNDIIKSQIWLNTSYATINLEPIKPRCLEHQDPAKSSNHLGFGPKLLTWNTGKGGRKT